MGVDVNLVPPFSIAAKGDIKILAGLTALSLLLPPDSEIVGCGLVVKSLLSPPIILLDSEVVTMATVDLSKLGGSMSGILISSHAFSGISNESLILVMRLSLIMGGAWRGAAGGLVKTGN